MIVEGRITKTKKRMSLMEQPYIKDNNKTVETFIKETIAQIGENISVRRFERCVPGAVVPYCQRSVDARSTHTPFHHIRLRCVPVFSALEQQKLVPQGPPKLSIA